MDTGKVRGYMRFSSVCVEIECFLDVIPAALSEYCVCIAVYEGNLSERIVANLVKYGIVHLAVESETAAFFLDIVDKSVQPLWGTLRILPTGTVSIHMPLQLSLPRFRLCMSP